MNEELEKDEEKKFQMRQYLYYLIIGIISFISLVFLPMIGSDIGLKWNFPNTTAGWIVFVVLRLIIAIINILIFHSFMEQAKLNVAENENYKKAREILLKTKSKNVTPRSPAKFNGTEYGKKGTTIFFTTFLTAIALSQALLTFDYMSMLIYLFTIIMGVICGIFQMKRAEIYWTDEYYRYALMILSSVNEGITENSQEGCSCHINIPEKDSCSEISQNYEEKKE